MTGTVSQGYAIWFYPVKTPDCDLLEISRLFWKSLDFRPFLKTRIGEEKSLIGWWSIIKKLQCAFMSGGATKIYKKECWDAIGGLLSSSGMGHAWWAKANMKGFETITIENLLNSLSHEPVSRRNLEKTGLKMEELIYYRYHPLFFLSKCCLRFFQKPFG